jgi:hypothetical protein
LNCDYTRMYLLVFLMRFCWNRFWQPYHDSIFVVLMPHFGFIIFTVIIPQTQVYWAKGRWLVWYCNRVSLNRGISIHLIRHCSQCMIFQRYWCELFLSVKIHLYFDFFIRILVLV